MGYKRRDRGLPYEYDEIHWGLLNILVYLGFVRSLIIMLIRFTHNEIFQSEGFLILSITSIIAIWLPVARYYKIFKAALIIAIISLFIEIIFTKLGSYTNLNIRPFWASHRVRTASMIGPFIY